MPGLKRPSPSARAALDRSDVEALEAALRQHADAALAALPQPQAKKLRPHADDLVASLFAAVSAHTDVVQPQLAEVEGLDKGLIDQERQLRAELDKTVGLANENHKALPDRAAKQMAALLAARRPAEPEAEPALAQPALAQPLDDAAMLDLRRGCERVGAEASKLIAELPVVAAKAQASVAAAGKFLAQAPTETDRVIAGEGAQAATAPARRTRQRLAAVGRGE